MFNLEQAITEWRQQMLAAGIKTPVPLDELESHLLEDMEREIQAGLSAQRAFETAVRRIGQAKALESEFAKVVERKETRERKLRLLCTVVAALAYLVVGVVTVGVPRPWCPMNPSEQWLGMAAVVLSVVGLFSGLFLRRFLPVILDQRVRARVQFASALPLLVWLCAFVYVILPRVEWTVAQVTVALLWAMSPLAIFGGLIFGLDESARRRNSAVGS